MESSGSPFLFQRLLHASEKVHREGLGEPGDLMEHGRGSHAAWHSAERVVACCEDVGTVQCRDGTHGRGPCDIVQYSWGSHVVWRGEARG